MGCWVGVLEGCGCRPPPGILAGCPFKPWVGSALAAWGARRCAHSSHPPRKHDACAAARPPHAQTPDGVRVPEVLKPFMLGIDFIPFRKVRAGGALDFQEGTRGGALHFQSAALQEEGERPALSTRGQGAMDACVTRGGAVATPPQCRPPLSSAPTRRQWTRAGST